MAGDDSNLRGGCLVVTVTTPTPAIGSAVTLSAPKSPNFTPASSGVWRFDAFVLDTQRYELRSGDEVIRVEPQVFDVLTQLISHHHRYLTKEELFDSVWGGRFGERGALPRGVRSHRRARPGPRRVLPDADHALA